jgi:CDP-diacylglycerol--glycerol-3-phosphate 3-phosphatidyltransferase
VPELRDALHHLFIQGQTTATDWQVLLYSGGRAMLWIVVLSACYSMYDYFKTFYQAVVERRAIAEKKRRSRVTEVITSGRSKQSDKVSIG